MHDYLKEQLKDPAFRKAYEEEGLFVEALLATRPKAALEHAKLFAKLPLPTKRAILKRRKKLARG